MSGCLIHISEADKARMSAPNAYEKVATFKKFIQDKGLIGFGGYKIRTTFDKNGVLKKTLGTAKWKQINADNYLEYIGEDNYGKPHTSFYIRTGKEFGISVLDFDTKEAYENWIEKFPECKNYLTQNTKKGFHILFKYSPEFPSNESNSEHENPNCKIDIRSKEGIIVAYPTSYFHHETKEEYKYEIFIDGELGTISKGMVKFFDDNGMRRLPDAVDTKGKMKKEKKKSDKKIAEMEDKAEEELEKISSQSGELFKKMCVCYTKQRVAEYNDWYEMGQMLKNHFVLKNNELEGKKCWKFFSQLKDEDGKLFYPNYDPDTLDEFWDKMKAPFKVKKVDKNKSWDKIKKWAKKDNPELFEEIFDVRRFIYTNSYEDMRTAFEENNFFVRDMGRFVELVNFDDGMRTNKRNPAEFQVAYENVFWTKVNKKETEDGVTFETEEREFSKDWRKDPNRKEYESMEFRPYCMTDTCPDNIYNTFKGYNALKYYSEWKKAVDKGENVISSDEDGLKLLLNHLKKLCGSIEFYEYFLDNLAYKIQYPHLKNNIASIFKSLPGAGKDSFFNWFGGFVIGQDYYLNIQGLSQLENFNALLDGKLLVVLNEFELKESINHQEKFKALITNIYNVINEKFEKQRKVRDFCSYYLLTNNEISVKIDQDCRRFTATEADNSICNDKELFDELYSEIYGIDETGKSNGEAYIAPFFDFLMKRNVLNKDWVKTRPETEYYKTLKEYNIDIIDRFWEFCFNKRSKYGVDWGHKADKFNEEENTTYFYASNFYKKFKDFSQSAGFSGCMTSTMFGTKLQKFCLATTEDINISESNEKDLKHKFLIKSKCGSQVYKIDNNRLKEYLIYKGIITEGVCLIKFDSDSDDDDDTTQEDN